MNLRRIVALVLVGWSLMLGAALRTWPLVELKLGTITGQKQGVYR
jgi:hypothetical protein